MSGGSGERTRSSDDDENAVDREEARSLHLREHEERRGARREDGVARREHRAPVEAIGDEPGERPEEDGG